MTPGERSCHGQKNSAQESLSAAQVRAGNREDGSMMMSAHVTAATKGVTASAKAMAATTEGVTASAKATEATRTTEVVAAERRATQVVAGKGLAA